MAVIKWHHSANVLEKFDKTLEEDAISDQPWLYRLATCAKSMFAVMGFVISPFGLALTGKQLLK